jgi:prepilin-type processing-associated H-X9-DG protein
MRTSTICPEDRTRSGSTYEINGYLRWLAIGAVPMPSETVLLVPEDDRGTSNDGYFDVQAGDFPNRRHNGGVNCAFVDGHVKWNAWKKADAHAACWPQ